jgi:hypothetical protein
VPFALQKIGSQLFCVNEVFLLLTVNGRFQQVLWKWEKVGMFLVFDLQGNIFHSIPLLSFQGAKRETLEETGLNIQTGQLLGVYNLVSAGQVLTIGFWLFALFMKVLGSLDF